MKKEFKAIVKRFGNQESYEEWVDQNNLDITVIDYDEDNPEKDVAFEPIIDGTGSYETHVIKNAPQWIFDIADEQDGN